MTSALIFYLKMVWENNINWDKTNEQWPVVFVLYKIPYFPLMLIF